MKITISDRWKLKFNAAAARMHESGKNVEILKDDEMSVLRHDSPEYHEWVAEDDACIFYTFEHQGTIFHVTYYLRATGDQSVFP